MTTWDLDDIAGVTEIADMLGVGRAAVSNWAVRHDDFPAPLKTLSAGSLYSRAQVKAWREGREWAHGGPGSAGHAAPDDDDDEPTEYCEVCRGYRSLDHDCCPPPCAACGLLIDRPCRLPTDHPQHAPGCPRERVHDNGDYHA